MIEALSFLLVWSNGVAKARADVALAGAVAEVARTHVAVAVNTVIKAGPVVLVVSSWLECPWHKIVVIGLAANPGEVSPIVFSSAPHSQEELDREEPVQPEYITVVLEKTAPAEHVVPFKCSEVFISLIIFQNGLGKAVVIHGGIVTPVLWFATKHICEQIADPPDEVPRQENIWNDDKLEPPSVKPLGGLIIPVFHLLWLKEVLCLNIWVVRIFDVYKGVVLKWLWVGVLKACLVNLLRRITEGNHIHTLGVKVASGLHVVPDRVENEVNVLLGLAVKYC